MNEIKEIGIVIDWYYNKGSSTQSIEDLLKSQDKLSVLSYYLAETTANIKADYNHCYFIRKIAVNKSINGLIGEKKYSKARAESESIEKHEAELQKEIQFESDAYKCDLLLRQVNKILDAMRSRISHLKAERQLTARQNQT